MNLDRLLVVFLRCPCKRAAACDRTLQDQAAAEQRATTKAATRAKQRQQFLYVFANGAVKASECAYQYLTYHCNAMKAVRVREVEQTQVELHVATLLSRYNETCTDLSTQSAQSELSKQQ